MTDRFSLESEQMTKDVGDEKILVSSFCYNDPQLETRSSSENQHYQSLIKKLSTIETYLTEASLEHAKALIDMY